MQNDAAHKLHIKMALSKRAFRRLADKSKSIYKHIIKSAALRYLAF